MKTCNRCKQSKELSEFGKNKRRKDGLQSYCKQCNRIYLRQHYKDNKDYYRAKAHDHRNKLREYVDSLKSEPCTDCHKKFHPVCMDFDHLYDKIANVAKMVSDGVSMSVLKTELAKCELVCACCHRLRTHSGIV